MLVEYRRDLSSNYMVFTPEEEDVVEANDYRLGMLISNNIPNLLKCSVRVVDGNVNYQYDITSKQPLKRSFEKKNIEYKDLKIILTGLLKAIDNVEEYLLNFSDISFDVEHIYVDVDSKEPYFAYIPRNLDENNFILLAEFILERIDHKDAKAVAIAYEIYRKFSDGTKGIKTILNEVLYRFAADNMEAECNDMETERGNVRKTTTDVLKTSARKNFDSEKNKKHKEKNKKKISLRKTIISAILGIFLGGIIGLIISVVKNLYIDGNIDLYKILSGLVIIICIVVYLFYSQYKADKRKKLADELILSNDDVYENEKNNKISDNNDKYTESDVIFEKALSIQSFDKTDDIEPIQSNEEEIEYGSTTLLAYKPEIRKLISIKELYEDINIDSDNYVIGKKANCVDGVINDEMISRIHARISYQGGKYYLTDLNSTNGTFCNDVRVEANQRIEIKEEDILRFGRVEFIFR